MPRIVGRERRRWNVVAAPPDFRLRLAVLRGGLGLVQSLQRPVVAFVQPPALLDRNPHQVERVERHPQRANRAREDRRVRDVERVAAFAQHTSGFRRLGSSSLGQIDVGPTGEPVFPVPRALAVSQQNELRHRVLRILSSTFSVLTSYAPPLRSTSASKRSASSFSAPMNGSSSVVTTMMPLSVTVWRRRSSSGL